MFPLSPGSLCTGRQAKVPLFFLKYRRKLKEGEHSENRLLFFQIGKRQPCHPRGPRQGHTEQHPPRASVSSSDMRGWRWGHQQRPNVNGHLHICWAVETVNGMAERPFPPGPQFQASRRVVCRWEQLATIASEKAWSHQGMSTVTSVQGPGVSTTPHC